MSEIYPFCISDEANYREKLIGVLAYLRTLIALVIQEDRGESSIGRRSAGPDWARFVDKEVLLGIKDAWPDIKIRLDKAEARVRELAYEDAQRHGLDGHELTMKLLPLLWASKELSKIPGNKVAEQISYRKEKRVMGVLKKNFDIIETIVDSILEATKAGTALKEIVKVFANCFKDFNKK